MIQLKDTFWHPCNIDVIEHKVVRIIQDERFTHYVLKAVRNVGACGRIEVIISQGSDGNFRFVDFLDYESVPYASGLQDFVEGFYYTSFERAQLDFYRQQETLSYSSMERHRRLFEESEKNYKRVKILVNELYEKCKTGSDK